MLPSTLLALTLSILRTVTAYTKDAQYEAGAYGSNPTQRYQSSSLTSPHLNVLQWDPACDDGLYTFFTPRGSGVAEAAAMILDSKGNLVWTMGGYNQIYNLQAQK